MAKKQSGNDLMDVKSRTNDDKGPKITDLVDVFSWKENSGKYVNMRLHGPVFSYCTYWVQTQTKEGKKTQFPVASPSYDPSTGDFDSTVYDPWKAYSDKEKADGVKPEDRKIRVSIEHYVNGIIRSEQKKEPAKRPTLSKAEKSTGFKDKESDSWTPNKAVRLTDNVLKLVKKRSQLNTVESSKTGQTKAYSVLHPKFGADLQIQFDSEAKVAANAYDVVLGKRRALTEDEQAELKWDLSNLQPVEKTDEEIKADFEGWARRNGIETSKAKKGTKAKAEDYDDNFEDDEDEPKSKKAKAKSKTRVEDDEDDEDDDDEAPKSKSKSKAKAKPSDDDEDDDDFGDDDDDEDDEDEPKSKSKKAKKPVEDDDEDEDDEDSDDDDDDDEPPAKSKSKAKSVAKGKKKPVEEDEDEDEDDSDEDDDEDEDEPPAKSKSKSKSKAKPSDDDEDDEDFGDDDEDDEDEEPKSKSKSKKAPAKKTSAKSKRKPSDDEDDEDEDDDE